MPATLVIVVTLAIAAQAAASQAPITVALTPVVPSGRVNLRWSPKGATVPLHLKAGAWFGSFALGPAGARAVTIKLGKTPGAPHYNTLWIDLNRNGKWSDSERLTTTPTLTRGKWWSTFDAVVAVPNAAGGGTRPYPLSLWYVEDPVEPDTAPALRWSRRGWHQGTVDIGGKRAWVLITEMEMDGVFDQRDAWAISRDSAGILKPDVRTLDEHAWLDGMAYRPVKIDPDGRSVTIVAVQTGTTEAEEAAKKDIYLPDRNVPRAATPLRFAADLRTAEEMARRNHKLVLIDFEAVWCGPC
ncbi:MAG: hypothetical protein ACREK8_01550, partial [Gemmatimonadales bacterium]